jgi:hypothetical protein
MQERRGDAERRYWMRCAAFFTVPQNGLSRTYRGLLRGGLGLD